MHPVWLCWTVVCVRAVLAEQASPCTLRRPQTTLDGGCSLPSCWRLPLSCRMKLSNVRIVQILCNCFAAIVRVYARE